MMTVMEKGGMPRQQTLELERARFAWAKVASVKRQSFEGEYESWAQKLPVLILTNGLGQTLAFLKSKANGEGKPAKAQSELFEHLTDWLKDTRTIPWESTEPDLLERIVNSSSDTYRVATSEALAFLTWLKRFAEGYLEKKKDVER